MSLTAGVQERAEGPSSMTSFAHQTKSSPTGLDWDLASLSESRSASQNPHGPAREMTSGKDTMTPGLGRGKTGRMRHTSARLRTSLSGHVPIPTAPEVVSRGVAVAALQ